MMLFALLCWSDLIAWADADFCLGDILVYASIPSPNLESVERVDEGKGSLLGTSSVGPTLVFISSTNQQIEDCR